MRKPPRKKAEPIITWRIRVRVVFSASIVVIGTLFVYYFALSNDQMISRRDQTHGANSLPYSHFVSILLTESKKQTDIFLLCLPRPRLGHPKPRAWLWSDAEPDAARHRRDFIPLAARARLRPLHAGRVPD
jgi:hypothetical protein